MIAGEERILSWEGLINVRDAGGLATIDGRRIARGALVRSDRLTHITPRGRAALIDHGVRTIIDVRSGEEVARDAAIYPFVNDTSSSVRYMHVPLTHGREDHAWEEMVKSYEAAQTREELNRLDIDLHAGGVGRIISTIAGAPEGGVLVHCHAGKDRTGVVIALALAVAGVADDDIADDYALTLRNLEALIADWLDEMSSDPVERARLRELATPRREAMLDTLAYVRERHGGAETYLAAAGVGSDQIERLRTRLVDDGGRPHG